MSTGEGCQFIKDSDEHKGLLMSVGPNTVPYGLERKASTTSSVDELINVEMSNSNASFADLNLETKVSAVPIEESTILDKAKNLAVFVKNFFAFSREFESFPELYA